MFENVKDWLDKGAKEKIIGYLILFVAVYGIVWGLVEPIIASDIVERNFGADAVKYWWKYQFFLSVLFTTGLYLWLVPKKVLQRIGAGPTDTKADSNFKSDGQPPIIVFNDGYYGKVYDIDARLQPNYLDYEILPGAHSATQIIYTYVPEQDFRLYLRVRLVSKNKKEEKLGWIALMTSISLPEEAGDKEEVKYPVTGENTKGGWIRTKVNIKEAVKATFGQKNWQYDKLLFVRMRGKAKIQSIILR